MSSDVPNETSAVHIFLLYFLGCGLVISLQVRVFLPLLVKYMMVESWFIATWCEETVKLVSQDLVVSKQNRTLTAITAQIVGL